MALPGDGTAHRRDYKLGIRNLPTTGYSPDGKHKLFYQRTGVMSKLQTKSGGIQTRVGSYSKGATCVNWIGMPQNPRFVLGLAVGPVYHHAENRIDSHIVLSSMAYGQFVTPKHNAKRCAPGLTLCAAFERFSTTQKVDFQLPTTDGASSCCAIRNRIGIRSSHWFSSNSGFPNNRCPGLHPIRPCWKTQTKIWPTF